MHGDDDVDVVEERGQARTTCSGLTAVDGMCHRKSGGCMTAYSDAPDRVGRRHGDDVGHLLERAAVVRHEPERRAEL